MTGSPVANFLEDMARGKLTVEYDAAIGRAIVTHADATIEISRENLNQLVKHGWAEELNGVLQFNGVNVAYELVGRDPEGTSYDGTRIYQRVEIEARHLESLVQWAGYNGGPAQARQAGEAVLKGYSEVGPK